MTDTSATLQGTVNPRGSSTSFQFEYGTDTTYGQTTTVTDAGAGSDAVGVSSPLSGLLASTTYHYRISATNAGGTVTGDDQWFTTAATAAPAPAP